VKNKIIPKVPIISFPKTGSSYINVILHRLFDVPHTVLSFNHQRGIKSWVNSFSKWGGLTHDHYFPTPVNLALLNNANIRRCIIHTRHPVETFISTSNHYLDQDLVIDPAKKNLRVNLLKDFIDQKIDTYFTGFHNWHQTWRHAAKTHDLVILETHYGDMKQDPAAFFKQILDFCEVPYNEQTLLKLLEELEPEKAKGQYNFRKAKHNEWQDVLTNQQIEKIKYYASLYGFAWEV
jgi:hypothetical protein